MIQAFALISNGIAADLTGRALTGDGHDPSVVGLVLQRQLNPACAAGVAQRYDFGKKASLHPLAQIQYLGFYMRATRALKRWLRSPELRDIYLVNNENMLCSHVLETVRRMPKSQRPRVTVVAEGFMNYQDIAIKDRAWWRWWVKPLASALLGLRYRKPTTHLSGAFEDVVDRVISYSDAGLRSPPDKVKILPYPTYPPPEGMEDGAVLLVMTGIGQWMTPEAYDRFKTDFARWFNAQNFSRVYYKRHPFYSSGGLEDLINNAEFFPDERNLEELAKDINVPTIVGYCTTGLVSLRLHRPDLRCIDWGHDLYCRDAYHGDFSIVPVLASAGIELVKSDQGGISV